MIEWNAFTTALAGIIGSLGSGFGTYLFTKKKYNAEVDSTRIDNMSKLLDVYTKQIEDLSKRLDLTLDRNLTLEREVVALRLQMYNFMSSVCIDFTCKLRKIDNTIMERIDKINPAENSE